MASAQGATKRFDSDYYVEGYATTFDSAYPIWEYDGVQFYEVVALDALNGADVSDVIFQYNHEGAVFARNKMGKHKQPCLILEPQQSGLFVAADLGQIEAAKRMYESIEAGLIYKMSWAFSVAEDSYNKDTHTRTILKIKKVYDVSAVSCPANDGTDIAARSWFDGVIEAEKREALARRTMLLKLHLELEG